MSSIYDYAGYGAWIAVKTSDLQNAYDLYQATQSQDAALNVATELS